MLAHINRTYSMNTHTFYLPFFPRKKKSNYVVSYFFSKCRYSAIMNPLRPRMGKRVTLGIAAAIWVVGSIIGAPNIFFFTTYEDTSMGVVLCYAEWPDGPQTESYQESW